MTWIRSANTEVLENSWTSLWSCYWRRTKSHILRRGDTRTQFGPFLLRRCGASGWTLCLLLVSALSCTLCDFVLWESSLTFRLNDKETRKAISLGDDNRVSTIGMSSGVRNWWYICLVQSLVKNSQTPRISVSGGRLSNEVSCHAQATPLNLRTDCAEPSQTCRTERWKHVHNSGGWEYAKCELEEWAEINKLKFNPNKYKARDE